MKKTSSAFLVNDKNSLKRWKDSSSLKRNQNTSLSLSFSKIPRFTKKNLFGKKSTPDVQVINTEKIQLHEEPQPSTSQGSSFGSSSHDLRMGESWYAKKKLFGKKSTEVVQVINTEKVQIHAEPQPSTSRGSTSGSSSDDLRMCGSWTPDHYANVYDSGKSSFFFSNSFLMFVSLVNRSQPPKIDLLEHLTTMEKKIDNQRQKVEELRHQLTPSSGDEGFQSSRSPTPPNANVQERIEHLEEISRFCVKETLEFITMYNKKQEINCKVRPEEHEELVKFCSELAESVSGEKQKKKWKKLKNFLKAVVGPFQKFSQLLSGDN